MPNWSAGLLPAPLNREPGMKLLEQTVNSTWGVNPPPFDPRAFGAAGNGQADDAPAWRRCLVEAVKLSASQIGYAVPVVDGRGLTYAIGSQVEVPGSYGLQIQNARFVATTTFSTASYLFATGSTLDATLADGFKINNLTLRGVTFDSRHRGGGFLLQRYNRVTVEACSFFGYQTVGLKTDIDGHEAFITNCRFGEYVWGDTSGTGYDHANLFVGTGLWLNTSDNHVDTCVIQLSLVGLKISKQANLVSGLHVWTGYVTTGTVLGGDAALSFVTTGVYLTASGIYCAFTGCYIDGCEFVMDDPWETSITNTLFLHGWGDPARSWIRLCPQAAGRSISGLVVKNCHFKVNDGGSIKACRVDTTSGTFSATMHGVAFKDNTFNGSTGGAAVTPFFSELRVRVEGVGATSWTYDFSTAFPVGVVQTLHMSPYYYGGGLASSEIRVTSVSGNVVTCTTTGAQNASVYLWADINIMPA